MFWNSQTKEWRQISTVTICNCYYYCCRCSCNCCDNMFQLRIGGNSWQSRLTKWDFKYCIFITDFICYFSRCFDIQTQQRLTDVVCDGVGRVTPLGTDQPDPPSCQPGQCRTPDSRYTYQCPGSGTRTSYRSRGSRLQCSPPVSDWGQVAGWTPSRRGGVASLPWCPVTTTTTNIGLVRNWQLLIKKSTHRHPSILVPFTCI